MAKDDDNAPFFLPMPKDPILIGTAFNAIARSMDEIEQHRATMERSMDDMLEVMRAQADLYPLDSEERR